MMYLYYYSNLSVRNIAQQVDLPIREVKAILNSLTKSDTMHLLAEQAKTSVDKIMSSDIVCLDHSKTASDAASLMITRKVGCVIVTVKKRPVGIVTERDLVKRIGQDDIYFRDVGRDINSLEDLKGKTIAISSEAHARLIVKAMLQHNGKGGLSENDLKFIDAGYYLVDPLVEKKADAAYGIFENYEMVEAKYSGLEEIKLFRFTNYGVPSYGYLVIVTNQHNFAEGRKIINRFLRALKKSVEFTLTSPQESLEYFLEGIPTLNDELNRHIYSHSLKCYKSDMSLHLEEWERLATFANENHLTGINNKEINGKEMIAHI
jgi:predicted transcriptional regulator